MRIKLSVIHHALRKTWLSSLRQQFRTGRWKTNSLWFLYNQLSCCIVFINILNCFDIKGWRWWWCCNGAHAYILVLQAFKAVVTVRFEYVKAALATWAKVERIKAKRLLIQIPSLVSARKNRRNIDISYSQSLGNRHGEIVGIKSCKAPWVKIVLGFVYTLKYTVTVLFAKPKT